MKNIKQLRIQKVGKALRRAIFNFDASRDAVRDILRDTRTQWNGGYLCIDIKEIVRDHIRQCIKNGGGSYDIHRIGLAQAAILQAIQVQLEFKYTMEQWLNKKGYVGLSFDEINDVRKQMLNAMWKEALNSYK